MSEKVERWWGGRFIFDDGIEYEGSIKKIKRLHDSTTTSNHYILVEVTNKAYYHHYSMITTTSEMLSKIMELAPLLQFLGVCIED